MECGVRKDVCSAGMQHTSAKRTVLIQVSRWLERKKKGTLNKFLFFVFSVCTYVLTKKCLMSNFDSKKQKKGIFFVCLLSASLRSQKEDFFSVQNLPGVTFQKTWKPGKFEMLQKSNLPWGLGGQKNTYLSLLFLSSSKRLMIFSLVSSNGIVSWPSKGNAFTSILGSLYCKYLKSLILPLYARL